MERNREGYLGIHRGVISTGTPTPGPWETGKLGHNVVGANGRLVAATMFVQFGNNSEDVANARLISQSPRLLAELKHAVRMLKAWDKEYGSQASDIQRMEAAIAAAEPDVDR